MLYGRIKFVKDCVKCGNTEDVFFFGDGDVCSDCKEQKKISTSKRAFYDRILELGGKIIGDYKSSRNPVECECKEGHKCNPSPGSIQQGRGMCKVCAGCDPVSAEANFRKRIKEIGGKVIGEYEGNSIPVECECKEGHKCDPIPGNIQQGHGMCKVCAGLDPLTAEANFRKRIEKLGGKVIGDYKGKNNPVECECKEGHKCNPRPSDIQQGHGMCRVCARCDPVATEANFRKSISELGGKVIGEYKRCGVPIECECKEGHKCNPRPASIRQGRGMCKVCAGLDPLTAEANFRNRIAELGGKVIGDYKGSGTPVECECKEGHKCNPYPCNIKQDHGMCKVCAGCDPVAAEANFRKRIAELGGKVIGEYKRCGVPVECECKEGHKCNPCPTSIQRGGGMCSSCGLKSEPLCRRIFEELLECSMSKARPSWLVWINGKPLELDGYNEELKIAFEYQGIQHYEYIPRFHRNGPDDLDNQQERDDFKAWKCCEQEVRLICVPCDYYYKDPEAMRAFIKSAIEEPDY